jgi:hypothetical protein
LDFFDFFNFLAFLRFVTFWTGGRLTFLKIFLEGRQFFWNFFFIFHWPLQTFFYFFITNFSSSRL